MTVSDAYTFRAEVWEWHGQASWHFVSLPEALTDEIDDRFGHLAAGFGSIKVEVRVGSTTWRTSVFPDTKRGTLILPMKKEVRRKQHLEAGSVAEVELRVVME
jgi:hypothetical protein